jgi:endoglucanase
MRHLSNPNVQSLTQLSWLFPLPPQDLQYAELLLQRAQQLFNFGDSFPGIWAGGQVGDSPNPYPSNSFQDDMALGAAWLCYANGNTSSAACATATKWWSLGYAIRGTAQHVDWENQMPMASAVLMLGNLGDSVLYALYSSHLTRLFTRWQTSSACGPYGVPLCYTDGGYMLAATWGAAGHNSAGSLLWMVMAKALQTLGDARGMQCYAIQQMDYILGSNPMETSFLTGYGTNFPRR